MGSGLRELLDAKIAPDLLQPTPCRCGAEAVQVAAGVVGRALWFVYRARMRFWCPRCWRRSLRLESLLGRLLQLGLIVLAFALAKLWWRP